MAKGQGFSSGHDEGIGKGNFANLPPETMMKLYPKNKPYSAPDLDDSMVDIDEIATSNEKTAEKYRSNQK